MSKPYTAKSLAGAQRRVRELEKQIKELDKALGRRMEECKILAKLAAKGPTFFNPLEIWEAEKVRDHELRNMNMNPDGTFISQGGKA
jgi:hypothetical protein